jgi:hypothetical protein
MHDREPFFQRHPYAADVLATAGLIAAVVLVSRVVAIEVTVPLMLPVGTTALAVWLAVCTFGNAITARRQAKAIAARYAVQSAAGRVEQPRLTRWRLDRGGPAGQRIGTADRVAVADVLGEHYAEGRLNDAEFERRRDAALAAVFRRDLSVLLRDLP